MWGGDSGHTYTFHRKPDGTGVDYVAVREGENLKERVLGIVLETIGKGTLGRLSMGPSRPSKPATTARKRRKPPDRMHLLDDER